jgi:hypothetical protein
MLIGYRFDAAAPAHASGSQVVSGASCPYLDHAGPLPRVARRHRLCQAAPSERAGLVD